MPDLESKKPQAKHLQTRAEYLLKILRKQAEFKASLPVSNIFFSCAVFQLNEILILTMLP